MTDTHNPFSPPRAQVADTTSAARPHTGTPPALWNPNAAAAWSLVFSPIFGAVLHMKNWEALGDTAKAAESRKWALTCTALMALVMVLAVSLPESPMLDVVLRGGGIGLLVAWYIMSAKAQVGLITARYATDYPRRGWGMPILVAIGAYVAAIAVLTVVLVAVSPAAP